MEQNWLIHDCTGSVVCGTGWYWVVLVQYNLVLLGIKWNWLIWGFNVCIYWKKLYLVGCHNSRTNKRTNEQTNKQGKIGLISQSTMEGWDEQLMMVEDYPLSQEKVKRNRKVFTSRLIRHKAEWGRVINSPTILRCKSPKAPIFDFCPPWLISALASPARFSPCCSWPSLFIFQSQTCCENR